MFLELSVSTNLIIVYVTNNLYFAITGLLYEMLSVINDYSVFKFQQEIKDLNSTLMAKTVVELYK